MTRWRRRAESAWRPWAIAAVRGLAVLAVVAAAGLVTRCPPRPLGWSRGVLLGRCAGADDGHAQGHGAVLADDGDGGVDLGALGAGQLVQAGLDPADELPDPADLLGGGGGIGAGPVIDSRDGGPEPFAGAHQVVKVSGQVGQVGDVGAEVVAAGAPEPDRAGAASGLHVGGLS